jgi:hypothetical protein
MKKNLSTITLEKTEVNELVNSLISVVTANVTGDRKDFEKARKTALKFLKNHKNEL